jgi:hypothetical protein
LRRGGCQGIILLAAIPSPIMIAQIHQSIGKYEPAIEAITVVMFCSLVLPRIARKPGKESSSISSPVPAQH